MLLLATYTVREKSLRVFRCPICEYQMLVTIPPKPKVHIKVLHLDSYTGFGEGKRSLVRKHTGYVKRATNGGKGDLL
jgi:hypothetical protein